MPAPIPPPPPQASEAETRLAVRWALAVMGVAALVFWAWASTYHLRSLFVDTGRSDTVTWVEWKLDTLDREALRAHEGGRVAWLVGSSMLRAAFDEAAINEGLAAAGHPWRVAKFGFSRGAPGPASGFARGLPLREGDLLVVNAFLNNYVRDWVTRSGLPPQRLLHLNGHAELWRLDERSVQERMETSLAVPDAFWTYHAEAMDGLSAWLMSPIDGRPKIKRRSELLTGNRRHLRFKHVDRDMSSPEDDSRFIAGAELDFTEAQVNLRGLRRLRAQAEAAGARFVLMWIPPTQAMQARMRDDEARARWAAFLEAEGAEAMPQLPDELYLDFNHLNYLGRAAMTPHLVQWLGEQALEP